MRILKILAVAFVLAGACSTANASSAYYQPTASIAALQAYGAASASVAHASITGIGNYNWNGADTSTADGWFVVAATGVSTGRWDYDWASSNILGLNWYGAVNSPGTVNKIDSTSAIQAAITSATLNATGGGGSTADQSNRNLICPDAYQMWVSNQLAFPKGVSLTGTAYGTRNCQINLKSTNATISASGVIKVGANATSTFYSTINNVWLNMNALNGIGMDFIGCQDNCGGQNNFIYQCMDGPCVNFDGTTGVSTNTFIWKNNLVFGSQSRTSGGYGMVFDGGTYPPIIDGNDVLCYTGHCFAANVHFHSMINASSSNWTLENSGGSGAGEGEGILVDGTTVLTSIRGVTTQNLTTGIELNSSSANSGAVLTSLFRINGTNTVKNDANCGPAQTVTTTIVPIYACGTDGYMDFTNLHVGNNIVVNASSLNIFPESSANSPFVAIKPASGAAGGNLRAHLELLDNSSPANGWDLWNGGDGTNAFVASSTAAGVETSRLSLNQSGKLLLYTAGSILQLTPTTSAAILAITCNAAEEGAIATVTDANSATFNAALAGGGANHMIAYCNGSAWVVH